MNLLSEILSSKIRSEIFRILFGINNNKLYMREIERCTGFSIGTVQRELKKLVRLDLLKKQRDGNRVYFLANKEHPLYSEIHNIVIKTTGLINVICNSLKRERKIKLAFVFGSIARNEENSKSDIDLMVIGDIGLRKLTTLISGLSDRLEREINPYVLTENDFIKRVISNEHFISNVVNSPKLFIIGNNNELKKMVK